MIRKVFAVKSDGNPVTFVMSAEPPLPGLTRGPSPNLPVQWGASTSSLAVEFSGHLLSHRDLCPEWGGLLERC